MSSPNNSTSLLSHVGMICSPEELVAQLEGVGALCHPDVLRYHNDLCSLRRHFHENPELGFKEHKTRLFVSNFLEELGLPVSTSAYTGVVAILEGKRGKQPVIALRADMDGLPIKEQTNLPFSSISNDMHACGHDGHMAILLVVAKILVEKRDLLAGTIKFVFQPAEEDGDDEHGPKGGAYEMVKEGILADVEEVYGLHLWNYDELGIIGVQEGPIMAACDMFDIEVNGCGGHGAAPQGTVDAIVVASSLVCALQTIVSRNQDPLHGAVVTIGEIHGGYAGNVIADKVVMKGTSRSYTPQARALALERISQICKGIGDSFGAEIIFNYIETCPNVINGSKKHVEHIKRAAEKVTQKEKVRPPYATMASEDFSYFLQERPGCFFLVGSAPNGPLRPHHKPEFTINEASLAIGASVFVHLVLDRLVA